MSRRRRCSAEADPPRRRARFALHPTGPRLRPAATDHLRQSCMCLPHPLLSAASTRHDTHGNNGCAKLTQIRKTLPNARASRWQHPYALEHGLRQQNMTARENCRKCEIWAKRGPSKDGNNNARRRAVHPCRPHVRNMLPPSLITGYVKAVWQDFWGTAKWP